MLMMLQVIRFPEKIKKLRHYFREEAASQQHKIFLLLRNFRSND